MLRTFHRKAALTVAAAAAALVLGIGPAFAAGGWTIVAAPPTGQNATLASVATVSGSDAWAVGYHSGAAFTNVGAKALIDNWNGTAWSQVAAPATPGNTALLLGVSASSATDAWAVGRTQLDKSSFEGLALHWNGTAWSVSPGFPRRCRWKRAPPPSGWPTSAPMTPTRSATAPPPPSVRSCTGTAPPGPR